MKITTVCCDVIKKVIESENRLHGKKLDLKLYSNNDGYDGVLLPYALFWDPLTYFQDWNPACPLCFQDGNLGQHFLSAGSWEFGQNNSTLPRFLWDVCWFSALVGRSYHCRNGHKIASYHAGLLQQMNLSKIPFLLSHDSGMTLQLFDNIQRLIDNCNTFSVVASILSETIIDSFYRRCFTLRSEKLDISTYFKVLSPSDDFIRKCYIVSYRANLGQYERLMSEINCKYISMDHTFKTATNIGYFVEGRWKTLYDSLFIALNEKGQVASYKLCASSAFDEIQENMEEIAKRNSSIDMIFVDNCCNWRQKIKSVFPNCEVKCDVFHGMQRLTKNIPKRHAFCSEACKDLTLIFRRCGDFGIKRKLNTPPPDVIIENMKHFLLKWDRVEYKGWKLLNEKFIKAWLNLKVHVENGCFTDIPPGQGTNRNENLHKQLRKILPRNRMGVETAHALFNAAFYHHNCRKEGMTFVEPIWIHTKQNTIPALPKEDILDTQMLMEDEIPSFDDIPYKPYGEHDYSVEVTYSLAATVTKLASVFSKIHEKFKRAGLDQKVFRRQGYTTLPVNIWSIEEYLFSCKKHYSPSFPLSEMLNELSMTMILQGNSEDFDILAALNLLVFDREKNAPEFGELLKAKNINFTNEITENKRILKEKMLSEIIDHIDYYESLIESDDVSTELKDFKDFDKFNDVIITFILQSAANLLNAVIVLIPMCLGIPLLPVIASQSPVDNTFFLVYDPLNNCFKGLIDTNAGARFLYCNCGKKDKEVRKRCTGDPRCSCSKRGVACTSSCRCKSCNNNKICKVKGKSRRKRIQPELSKEKTLSSISAAMLSGDFEFEKVLKFSHHFYLEAITYIYIRDIKAKFEDINPGSLEEYLKEKIISINKELQIYNIDMIDGLQDNLISIWVKRRMNLEMLCTQLKAGLLNGEASDTLEKNVVETGD